MNDTCLLPPLILTDSCEIKISNDNTVETLFGKLVNVAVILILYVILGVPMNFSI